MENQRKPTAPGTPHRSSVEQLQGLWHTLARWHSTKPLMWSAGGNAGMLVVKGLSFGKANFNIWFLHHTLLTSQQIYQESYFSIPPQGRSSTMGLWPPGTHKWGLGSIRTNECCWHFNLDPAASWASDILPTPVHCNAYGFTWQPFSKRNRDHPTLRLGVKFQPKKVWFWGGFLGSPNFRLLELHDPEIFWPL